ncbi:ABC transporter substrate-binding protein [Glaciimonas sp. PCH181]|uniref:ABC transporter substrate-binding protein n=1 Tax=Glaciimonas sp. PCH181 TaxID=2133943 RepID=UPI000D37ED77|nr:ABC transporter substrate-binding protein [Glaciimonas sp. PCH181]PUA19656.1 aliphatic sulfonate ABC transporter substrate-binding protein [Glaciimonas sp. PCH181]
MSDFGSTNNSDATTGAPFSRRRFLQTALGSSAAIGLGLSGGASNALAAPLTRDTLLRVATYKGDARQFHKVIGVDNTPYRVEYAEFSGGNLIVEAINGGSIDLGTMSEIPPIFSVQSGAPLKLIAILQGDVNNQTLLVPEKSKIRDVAELKGLRVGYVRSTTSHYLLLRYLQEKGLSFADIKPISLSPQDGLAAFQSGQLDAWVIYGPMIQLVLKQGAHIVKTGLGYLSGNYLYAAHTKAIADPVRHAAIADYLQRERKVYDWINRNHDAYAGGLAKTTGLPKWLFDAQLKQQSQPFKLIAIDDAAVRSQQKIADTFTEHKVIDRRIDVSGLWDRSFSSALV